METRPEARLAAVTSMASLVSFDRRASFPRRLAGLLAVLAVPLAIGMLATVPSIHPLTRFLFAYTPARLVHGLAHVQIRGAERIASGADRDDVALVDRAAVLRRFVGRHVSRVA